MSDYKALKISILPARHGIAWLMQSLALVRTQPSRLLFLAVLLQLILGLSRLPLMGIFVVMAMPALSAGLLQGFYMVATGQRPLSSILFLPLFSRPRTGRLLALGLVLFVVGIVSASVILSGSESTLDPGLMAKIEQGDFAAVKELDPELVSKIIMAALVGVSISGTLSFMSIPLIWFRDQKLLTALASGVKALFLNWRPFLVLTLGLFALLVPILVVLSLLYQLSGMSGILSIFLLGLIMLIALAFQLIIFGTQYCSFLEIYGLDSLETELGDAESNDHQLVA